MPTLLVAILILGALGLFLSLPAGRGGAARAGLVLLAAAGATLAYGVARWATGEAGLCLFVISGLVGLFAAARVVTHRKPVYSALYFVLLVVAVAVLLLLMQAEFLAAALIIVYGGAILVTYVFVIMLAQQAHPAPYDTHARDPFWGCLAGFALVTVITAQLFVGQDSGPLPETVAEAAGTVEVVGTSLLTQYVVGIQLAGLLLLAAMVGAIAIARRRLRSESDFDYEGDA